MLSKTQLNGMERTGMYVMLAYRTSVQEFTQASPFHLLYGYDLWRNPVCTSDQMSVWCWKLSRGAGDWSTGYIGDGAGPRKEGPAKNCDKGATPVTLSKVERIYLHFPPKRRNHCLPFPYLYQIINCYANSAGIRTIDQPQQAATRISLNRLFIGLHTSLLLHAIVACHYPCLACIYRGLHRQLFGNLIPTLNFTIAHEIHLYFHATECPPSHPLSAADLQLQISSYALLFDLHSVLFYPIHFPSLHGCMKG